MQNFGGMKIENIKIKTNFNIHYTMQNFSINIETFLNHI